MAAESEGDRGRADLATVVENMLRIRRQRPAWDPAEARLYERHARKRRGSFTIRKPLQHAGAVAATVARLREAGHYVQTLSRACASALAELDVEVQLLDDRLCNLSGCCERTRVSQLVDCGLACNLCDAALVRKLEAIRDRVGGSTTARTDRGRRARAVVVDATRLNRRRGSAPLQWEAEAARHLAEEPDMTNEELAERIGKHVGTIAHSKVVQRARKAARGGRAVADAGEDRGDE